MGGITYQHQDLADGRWATMSIPEQMANIGSEVSRALSAQRRGKPERMEQAFFRALELFDLSLASRKGAALGEFCRAREELCDYFYGGNTWRTDPVRLQKYYDQFVSLVRK